MIGMTWGEFKRLAESKGARDEQRIFYIDTGNYPRAEDLNVHVDDNDLTIE